MSWLESLFYGLVSGLAECLPISAGAHRTLLLKLIGGADGPWMLLAVHLGALAALLLSSWPALSRMNRERRLASVPKARRKRQPDAKTMLELRILKTAAVFAVLGMVVNLLIGNLWQRLWILGLLLLLNGLVLYLPQFLPGSNKDARGISALDAMLIGLSCGVGSVPGLSPLGTGIGTALTRGTQKRYGLDLVYLLCIPVLFVCILADGYQIFQGSTLSFMTVLNAVTAAASSFGGAYIGVLLMRFLSVNAGFGSFAYYSWGTAVLAFILYLLT